ncbi:hypothetical protein G6O67_008762 [Ophiocordyceps sinensis]|uniref:Uncharacterized protein n=1 Tax=Ophiocordyceps sinensis TaxID=72228 RepID=A0A8H4LS50_9HYPO|nr:hypothetical protein G6O67_008914 [Ophiocordyceps sinensis]KAF4504151.1 hypothetical protein G6O67_008762 [Ophiocordyceps sinensis]
MFKLANVCCLSLLLLLLVPETCNAEAPALHIRDKAPAPTWRFLGGWFYSRPEVVSWAPNRTDVFVRDSF